MATDIKDQRRISQTDSKDTGKIIEKIRFNTLYEGGTDLINETTVTIECSNEKIKIKLSNFQYSIGSDTSKVIIDNIIQFAAPEQIARHRMWYPIDRTATEIIANFRTWLKSKL
ncbi:hypothetical protein FLA_4694 [Filimonas lacunae]|nr:hypothetical protein FLA_4694 [Filimonas lacunae]